MPFGVRSRPESFFRRPGDESLDMADCVGCERPLSVWQALLALGPERWEEMARDVFGCLGCHLSVETVLERVRATDTCSNLDPPVSVWIDAEGWWTVDVYDEREE